MEKNRTCFEQLERNSVRFAEAASLIMKSDFLPSYLGSATMMDCGGPDPDDPSGKREAARMGTIAIGMAAAVSEFGTRTAAQLRVWDDDG